MPTPAKKKPRQSSVDAGARGARGRRVVFLRIPPQLYEKLQRITAAALVNGERGTISGTVMKLIEQAKEKA